MTYNGICPKCKLHNGTYFWWQESNNRWVCYACGMGRRNEQIKLDAQYQKQFKTSGSHGDMGSGRDKNKIITKDLT